MQTNVKTRTVVASRRASTALDRTNALVRSVTGSGRIDISARKVRQCSYPTLFIFQIFLKTDRGNKIEYCDLHSFHLPHFTAPSLGHLLKFIINSIKYCVHHRYSLVEK